MLERGCVYISHTPTIGSTPLPPTPAMGVCVVGVGFLFLCTASESVRVLGADQVKKIPFEIVLYTGSYTEVFSLMIIYFFQ